MKSLRFLFVLFIPAKAFCALVFPEAPALEYYEAIYPHPFERIVIGSLDNSAVELTQDEVWRADEVEILKPVYTNGYQLNIDTRNPKFSSRVQGS